MAATTTSSEEEEKKKKTRKQPSKVQKKGPKRCLSYLSRGKTLRILPGHAGILTEPALNGGFLCKDLAETYKHCVDVGFENIPGDAGFHASCYTFH